MNPFTYQRVDAPEAALHAIELHNSKFLGGGTNLIDLMKDGVETPTALLEEAKRNKLSTVSFETGTTSKPTLTDDEIRERMSGNICRCGAYPNIVAAVRTLAGVKA